MQQWYLSTLQKSNLLLTHIPVEKAGGVTSRIELRRFYLFFLKSDNIRTAVYKTVLALQKWSGHDQKLSTRRLANQ